MKAILLILLLATEHAQALSFTQALNQIEQHESILLEKSQSNSLREASKCIGRTEI